MAGAIIHYNKVSEARDGFKSLLDAAEAGTPATVSRDGHLAAIVDARRLAHTLGRLQPLPEMFHEEESWWIVIPGLPVSADGATTEDAVADMITALREYAEDWIARLSVASNHSENWGLVQFVALSSDQDLREWITGQAATP